MTELELSLLQSAALGGKIQLQHAYKAKKREYPKQDATETDKTTAVRNLVRKGWLAINPATQAYNITERGREELQRQQKG